MEPVKVLKIKALTAFVSGTCSAEADEVLEVTLPKGKELVILGFAEIPGDPEVTAALRKKGPAEIRALKHIRTLSYAMNPGEIRTVSHKEAQLFVDQGLAEVTEPEKTDVHPTERKLIENLNKLLEED